VQLKECARQETPHSAHSSEECYTAREINPLNAELNPIRHLLALVGARHLVHVSRIRVNDVALLVNGTRQFFSFTVSLSSLSRINQQYYVFNTFDVLL
jgi:hypothetical protein